MEKKKDQIRVILVGADEDKCYKHIDRYVSGFKMMKEVLKMPNLNLDEGQSAIVDADGNSVKFLAAIMEHEPDQKLLETVYRYSCGANDVDLFEVFKMFGLQKADFSQKTILICYYNKDTVPAKNLKRLVRYARIGMPVVVLDKEGLSGCEEASPTLRQTYREPALTYKSKFNGEGDDFEEAARVIWSSDLWRPEHLELAPIFKVASALLGITCEKS